MIVFPKLIFYLGILIINEILISLIIYIYIYIERERERETET